MRNPGSVANPVGAHASNGSLSGVVTLTRPAGADVLMIQAFAQAIRYTLDGTAPSTSNGFQLASGEFRVVEVGLATAVKVIEATTSATIQYQWAAILPAQR